MPITSTIEHLKEVFQERANLIQALKNLKEHDNKPIRPCWVSSSYDYIPFTVELSKEAQEDLKDAFKEICKQRILLLNTQVIMYCKQLLEEGLPNVKER